MTPNGRPGPPKTSDGSRHHARRRRGVPRVAMLLGRRGIQVGPGARGPVAETRGLDNRRPGSASRTGAWTHREHLRPGAYTTPGQGRSARGSRDISHRTSPGLAGSIPSWAYLTRTCSISGNCDAAKTAADSKRGAKWRSITTPRRNTSSVPAEAISRRRATRGTLHTTSTVTPPGIRSGADAKAAYPTSAPRPSPRPQRDLRGGIVSMSTKAVPAYRDA